MPERVGTRPRAAVWPPGWGWLPEHGRPWTTDLESAVREHLRRALRQLSIWSLAEVAPGRLVPWLAVAFGSGTIFYFGADQEPSVWAAGLVVALACAAAYLARSRPAIFPLAVAAAVSIKPWLWPLIVWLLLVRPRAGVRAAVFSVVIPLAAWAAIGFHGMLAYRGLAHAEAQRFVRAGVLYVAALVQSGVPVYAAAAIGAFTFERRQGDGGETAAGGREQGEDGDGESELPAVP